MTSRDAYMLVYMRREAAPGGPVKIQQPPQRALDVVLQMNQRHANSCASFAKRSIAGAPLFGYANRRLRREELKTEFLELRSKMRDIYLSWNVSSCDQVG